MSRPRITDAGAAGLPLREGRAELLEEIMATPTIESTLPSYDEGHPRHRRWIAAVGAAAAVAAVLGGSAWLGQQDPSGRESTPVTAMPSDVGVGDMAVLAAPGWKVRNVDEDLAGGEISYLDGDRQLDIHWRPADQYDAYVADRNDVGAPTEVELLGRTSLLWAYDELDHTVIRPVEQRFTLEVRGSGMTRAAFLDLLTQLHRVDAVGLAEHLDSTGKVSRADRDYQAPPVPVLLTADGWTPVVDGYGNLAWAGPEGHLAQVWVDGVRDPFTYDRYLGLANREETRLLGGRALLAEWQEGGVRYRMAATSPLTGDTILVLEAAGMSRAGFLEAVRSVQRVSASKYERVVKAAME